MGVGLAAAPGAACTTTKSHVLYQKWLQGHCAWGVPQGEAVPGHTIMHVEAGWDSLEHRPGA